MKKPRYALILPVITLALIVLSGCTKKDEAIQKDKFASLVESVAPEYVTEWPENEYTHYLIKPEHGAIDYVLDYSDAGRYAVWIKDITPTQSKEYVTALQTHGFAIDYSEKNSVSVGTTMRKDNVVLSVSYSETSFGVLIAVEND